MVFCLEHSKGDQNPKFTPLSETTSIPTSFIYGVPTPGALYDLVRLENRLRHRLS